MEEREGDGSLHRRLRRVDPETASRLAPRDIQRILRALEVFELTGKSLSEHHRAQQPAVCPPSTPVIYLLRERRDLYARIEKRCHKMVEAGLPQEVQNLLAGGLKPQAPGLLTLGYREWIPWVFGQCDRQGAMDQFLRNSRRYAKRQDTWFRNRHPDRFDLTIAREDDPEEVAERVLSLLRGAARKPQDRR
jgi:tRNA dimethylallyltransferase